uniref:V-set and transmembrane domain containing 2 like n=1 Tax=Cyclopterus lumpus TaxID=8103 RepID=A0A8C3A336_CYCLU
RRLTEVLLWISPCSFAALFTEAPRDVTTQSGEDVEMACSFRGAGAPSHLLEIQWWYMKDHRDRQEKADPIAMNNVEPLEETSKDATKISVVKVAGSNISHKLRLSSVTPADEGTYECRVIDFSGGGAAERRRHRVRARLQVAPEWSFTPQEPGRRPQGGPETEGPETEGPETEGPETEGRDLKRRAAGGTTDCTGSCGL